MFEWNKAYTQTKVAPQNRPLYSWRHSVQCVAFILSTTAPARQYTALKACFEKWSSLLCTPLPWFHLLPDRISETVVYYAPTTRTERLCEFDVIVVKREECGETAPTKFVQDWGEICLVDKVSLPIYWLLHNETPCDKIWKTVVFVSALSSETSERPLRRSPRRRSLSGHALLGGVEMSRTPVPVAQMQLLRHCYVFVFSFVIVLFIQNRYFLIEYSFNLGECYWFYFGLRMQL